MEERQVTLEGDSLGLPDPFLVLATQNPVEYEGTYPLPEAELDRFIFKAVVRYPGTEEERAILRAHDHGQPSANIATLEPFDRGTLDACRTEVDAVKVEDSVLDYVGRIAAESRRSPDLILGASPRAAVHLLRAAKAAAAIEGRDFATPDDVKSLATPTLRHRVVLKAEAEIEGLDADAVVRRVLARRRGGRDLRRPPPLSRLVPVRRGPPAAARTPRSHRTPGTRAGRRARERVPGPPGDPALRGLAPARARI